MKNGIAAIDFLPPVPGHRAAHGIGIIGCGGIVRSQHIPAYRAQGFRIAAVADISEANARAASKLADGAPWFTDHRRLLERRDVTVVDAATHPAVRVGLIRDALEAGKHVLSQKPFVLDLDAGVRLVALAKRRRRLLAVNQNGRWDPARKAAYDLIRAGAIGRVLSVHLRDQWNHGWVAGTAFDIRHCLLYDYGIHNFDILTCWMEGREPTAVFASQTRAANQAARTDLLAQAHVTYDGAQATVVFDGSVDDAPGGGFAICGTKGSLAGVGGGLELRAASGLWRPKLRGNWFPDGFKATMGALLVAIERGRTPWHAAERNLKSLQLCFAACRSADTGRPVVPASVRRLPPGNDRPLRARR